MKPLKLTQLETPDVYIEERDGRPCLVSATYGDIYYSTKNGLDETELVFIDGNDLIARMRAQNRIVVAETGFGTGLNFLALLRHWAELWAELGADAPQLYFTTCELAPLDAKLIKEMLHHFPALREFIPMLLSILPPAWPGRHRRHLFGGKVVVDFLYGDSLEMIKASDFKADAWFLDGFTPSRNPAMWQDELFLEIARCSAPDATIASFTAAGDVKRGLTAAGFAIERKSAEPHKWHRIIGKRVKGASAKFNNNINYTAQRIVIVGSGIAGASVAAGLMRQGITPLILSQGDGPHDGASGNIVAVQTPRLTALDTHPGRFSVAAYGYARWCSAQLGADLDDCSISYGWNEREYSRQFKILEQGWPESLLRVDDDQKIIDAAGVDAKMDGLVFPHGGSIDPRILCSALLEGAEIQYGVTLEGFHQQDDGRWALATNQGEIIADQFVLATGWGLAPLTKGWLDPYFDFQVTAGRVSHLPPSAFPSLKAAISFGGYLARAGDGSLALGASFDRDIEGEDLPAIDADAHEINRQLLPAHMRDAAGDASNWQGRASWRLAATDRQPVAGKVGKGLYILAALGARGMVTGPIAGDHVASLITDAPSPFDRGMRGVVNPYRFSARKGF